MMEQKKYTGVWYNKQKKLWEVTFQHKYRGRYLTQDEAIAVRKKLEQTTNRATDFQLTCYRLCSPDFAGLTQVEAAKRLHSYQASVFRALRSLKKKYPILFPIYKKKPRTHRYEEWMSQLIQSA